MSDFIEKRKFPRVEVSVPLRYKKLYGTTYLSSGTLTKNISEGGIRFSTDKFISLACRLLLELRLPSVPRSIKAISKVAWIKRLPSGNVYEVGNQFLAMTKEDDKIISDYLENIANLAKA
ncbi:MAG: hypothetical protein A2Z72_07305 [Omnitrophica bacterium RBG_13_46_9]|nr:MAG: hypothetical protein A2Z72_07305 [Omnitrophica bacterium RBG_13_46_9]